MEEMHSLNDVIEELEDRRYKITIREELDTDGVATGRTILKLVKKGYQLTNYYNLSVYSESTLEAFLIYKLRSMVDEFERYTITNDKFIRFI